MDGWMDFKNVAFILNEVLFSHEKWNLVIWMDLEGILLSEISQRKIKHVLLTCGIWILKRNEKQNQVHRHSKWVGGCWRRGLGKRVEMSEGSQKAQTSNDQISNSWGYDIHHTAIINNSVLCIWKLLRENLKSSHHKKKIVTMHGDKC